MAKQLKMSSAREVRRTVNRISNMLLNGQLDPKTANAILYGCNVCLGAIRTDEQEKKIDELEKIVEQLGQSKNMVSRYEKGENAPSLAAAVTIAEFFDVSLDYLVGRE